MTRPTIYPRSVALRVAARRAQGWTWEQIHATFGIKAPTARNLLDFYKLPDEFKPAAKEETWRRPCSQCGSTEERRKWLFRCDTCRRLIASECGAQDFMYVGSSTGSND